jgi:hypothetical protein
VLALAFFTSLIYGVLGKRFDHQRPAVAMSFEVTGTYDDARVRTDSREQPGNEQWFPSASRR